MALPYLPSEKQIEAIAYELAERFFKRLGGGNSYQDVDQLAADLADAIRVFLGQPNPN